MWPHFEDQQKLYVGGDEVVVHFGWVEVLSSDCAGGRLSGILHLWELARTVR